MVCFLLVGKKRGEEERGTRKNAIMTYLFMISRACCLLRVTSLSSKWFIAFFALVVISSYHTDSIENRSMPCFLRYLCY